MPSPMAATSRRIAWPTVTIDSRATVSGSASCMATSAMDWVMSRNSCDRQAMWASTEEDDRGEEDGGHHAEHRGGQAGRAERSLEVGKVHPAEHQPGQHPDHREHGGDDVGGARRPALQRAQDLSDRSRSSLAGRRSEPILGAANLVVERLLLDGRGAHGAPRLLRRRFLWPRVTGADGMMGSGGVSRTLSASWIADRAASVGSFIFFGVFAMSVVASHYAGPEPRQEDPRPRHERVSLEIPRIPGSRQQRAAQISHCRSVILSAWQNKGNRLLRSLNHR